MTDILYPLRCLRGSLHHAAAERKERQHFRRFLKSADPETVIFGTPLHTNLGDGAIVCAEALFLARCGLSTEKTIEVTFPDAKKYLTMLSKVFAKKDVLFCFHGGGNMGDQWFPEEQFRREALSAFRDKKALVFPQTVYYTDTEKGFSEQEKSVPFYNRSKNFTLAAREISSYDSMRRLYPNANCLLTPDIVLSTVLDDYDTAETERHGILLCARSDMEKKTDRSLWAALDSWLTQSGKATQYTDMYSDIPVTKDNRRMVVSKKMQEFRSAELVITDRLHGMVFSAIAGTPCVVFGNCNHKVKGTYDWISYLPYIKYVETLDEAKEAVTELQTLRNCRFSNEPLLPHFQKLSDEIIKVSNAINNRPSL